ncbi:MAG: winged helix-turn-helix domain-containing protein [Candidatus Poribacteria bacterium]|nr:winged helix-turn-helix domain-containing protein [Candidatus Poribacteria bacterium]
MIDGIGRTAGEIWHYLHENGEATISKLTRELDQSERTILMGIGWLARESNLVFSTQGRFTYIALKGSESG